MTVNLLYGIALKIQTCRLYLYLRKHLETFCQETFVNKVECDKFRLLWDDILNYIRRIPISYFSTADKIYLFFFPEQEVLHILNIIFTKCTFF